MKPQSVVFVLLFCLCLGCEEEAKDSLAETETEIETESKEILVSKPELIYDSLYIATSFDFPVGKPDAKGYYNAQEFHQDFHLGDDWNAVTGGNTDLGDPVYAIANGYVKFAEDHAGAWGNVIRILHKMPNGEMVESLYAHCDTILVQEKEWVKRGQQIGTIGTADGIYFAHLHFEIRDSIELPIGVGYSDADTTAGYLDPTAFIKANR